MNHQWNILPTEVEEACIHNFVSSRYLFWFDKFIIVWSPTENLLSSTTFLLCNTHDLSRTTHTTKKQYLSPFYTNCLKCSKRSTRVPLIRRAVHSSIYNKIVFQLLKSNYQMSRYRPKYCYYIIFHEISGLFFDQKNSAPPRNFQNIGTCFTSM